MEDVTAARHAFVAKLQTPNNLGGRSVCMAASPLRTTSEEALTALEAGWDVTDQLASAPSLAVVKTLAEAEFTSLVELGLEEMLAERVQQVQLEGAACW